MPWLWEQHNEHRLPLSRLVYLADSASRTTSAPGCSSRSRCSRRSRLGLMRLAAGLRGRPDWADLFFPISLLHLGHWENFLLGYQLCFALHLLFATGLRRGCTRRSAKTAFRSGRAAAGCCSCSLLSPAARAWRSCRRSRPGSSTSRSSRRGRMGSEGRPLVAVLALASVTLPRGLLHRLRAAREPSAAEH